MIGPVLGTAAMLRKVRGCWISSRGVALLFSIAQVFQLKFWLRKRCNGEEQSSKSRVVKKQSI